MRRKLLMQIIAQTLDDWTLRNDFILVSFCPFFAFYRCGPPSSRRARQHTAAPSNPPPDHSVRPLSPHSAIACPKAKIVIFGDAIRKPFIANPAADTMDNGGRHEGRLRRRAPPSGTSAAACSTGQRGRIRNPSGTGLADRSSPPCRTFTHPSGRGRFAQGDQLSVEMDDKAQTMNRDPWLRTVSPGFAGNSLPVCPTMPRGITGRCITRLQHSSGGRDARLAADRLVSATGKSGIRALPGSRATRRPKNISVAAAQAEPCRRGGRKATAVGSHC